MIRQFTAVSNSTIFDVCLNTYGTLDLLGKLMTDNNHDGVDVYPLAGKVYNYEDTLVKNISASNLYQPTQINSNFTGRKYATQ